MLHDIIIVILSIIGFSISFYIRHHRVNHKELYCPLKAKCDVVVNSKYNKLFGVHNDNLGMLYYGIFSLFFLSSLKYNILENKYANLFVLTVAAIATVYSAYLTLVQIIKIKEFCHWCLLSAITCLSIFIALLL